MSASWSRTGGVPAQTCENHQKKELKNKKINIGDTILAVDGTPADPKTVLTLLRGSDQGALQERRRHVLLRTVRGEPPRCGLIAGNICNPPDRLQSLSTLECKAGLPMDPGTRDELFGP